ncbi:threonine/serine exporter ThrE family protein [Streptomyces sp. NPDC099050]|uniref:threonine/serine ThrE exporter family protein n=1 Tax=Streptomyces sp. NPDC099050 TaxID=3366100 RepID=UPI003812FE97
MLWTPVPRALSAAEEIAEREAEAVRVSAAVMDLALSIGDVLLASGLGAEDVEAAMLGVTYTYGLVPCDPQVTFTMISISYQATPHTVPMTATRTVRRRSSDYTRLRAVHELVGRIMDGGLAVDEASSCLAQVQSSPCPYPGWVLSGATGALAAGAALLVSGRWDGQAVLLFVVAFAAALCGERLAVLLSKAGVPEFYQYVAAAMPASACGVALALAGAGLQGSAVITGGLFALLPGRAFVAAAEDGLTGFYLTAGARLLEAVYLVTAIVIGVLAILPIGVSLGAPLRPEESWTQDSFPLLQLASAWVLSLALALLLQCPRRAAVFCAFNGAAAWCVFAVLTGQAGMGTVTATGIAAGLAGIFGQLAARHRRSSSLPYVTAALGPLLPGSALYRGVLAFIQGRGETGLVELSRALALAVALAVGVHAGRELVRLSHHVPHITGRRREAAQRTGGF